MEGGLDGRSPAARLAVVCVVSMVLGRLGALDPTGERCSSRKMPGNRVSAPDLRWGWEEARLHLYSGVLIHPREGGDDDTQSPRRWCHLHLIHCSVFTSDKQIAEEKESLSPSIPHWADCLDFSWGLGDSGRAGGGQRWRGWGELHPTCRRLVFSSSALSAT